MMLKISLGLALTVVFWVLTIISVGIVADFQGFDALNKGFLAGSVSAIVTLSFINWWWEHVDL